MVRVPVRATISFTEAFDVSQNIVQALLICPEHWATSNFRETVAVDVHNIDITWSNGDAVFQDTRPFVDQRIQTTLQNLIVVNFGALIPSSADVSSTMDTTSGSVSSRGCFQGRCKPAIGFLPKAIHFAELVGHAGGYRYIFGLHAAEFVGAPTQIKAIGRSSGRPHGHAKLQQGIVHLIGSCALQNNLASLAGIAAEHAVTDEARGVTGQYGDLI